jgi:ATP-dependent RNA helicase DeaD|tara:strand:- start:1509 stop:3155 length:1647 start_codon:yes stop_codon:yes gene_type:complete
MASFDKYGFNKELLESISGLGFKIPTPIQTKVIPEILSSDNDIIATAQTGTGKTAAFGLPLIHLTNNRKKTIESVILCPTRELCLQISKDLNIYSEHMKYNRIVPIYGGSKVETQIKGLKQNPKIIVCTPGRLNDLIKRRRVDLSFVKYFVLDEADEMLSMGFKSEIDSVLENVPKDRKIYLFSATMSKKVKNITQTYMKHPLIISTASDNKGADNVKHHYYFSNKGQRFDIIKNIININKDIYTIIFCRTRRETKEISSQLIQANYKANVLNGDLSQEERDRVMNQFRTKKIQILVATDVASRGIDVNNLSHIINYNLPDDPEVYVHRSGRTGRAGNKGTSIVLISKKEYKRLREIEKLSKISFIKSVPPSDSEVFKTQIHSFIDKIVSVPVPNKEDRELFKELYTKLNDFTKDEIIGKIISINSKNTKSPKIDKTNKNDENQNRAKNIDKSISKLTINIGRSNNMSPDMLIRLINKTIRVRNTKIGKISVKKNYSTFEVDYEMEKTIKSKMNNIRYNGLKVTISDYNGEIVELHQKRKNKFKKRRK